MASQGDLTALTRSLGNTEPVHTAELHQLEAFYTPLEERIERISRLGRRAMEVRVAAVSLVVGKKQWFKSVVGWQIDSLPIMDSLCHPVLQSGEPLVVPDTSKDPRFSSARLVMQGPKFRFYAGHPLRDSNGKIIGTFCVFDVDTKPASNELMTTLVDLGQLAERELATVDLRDTQKQLATKLGEARRDATLDTLTNVWNRRGGMQLLDMMLERSQKTNEQFAVCMADVDYFKSINDDHGHMAGDEVLRNIADALVSAVRPNDIVARYGGDEFMLILRDCNEDGARIVAERIRSNLDGKELRTDKGAATITLSMGIAMNDPSTINSAQQIIDWADQALYHRKKSGRDGVSLWPSDV